MNRLVEPIPFPIDQLREYAQSRKICVWGAGNQGRGIASVLVRNGIAVHSFIDSSELLQGTEISGIPVVSPEIVDTESGSLFIVIATFFYSDQIAQKCLSLGMKESEDFVHYARLKSHDYSIDVSGTCNLRCIACPRAENGRGERVAGFMSLDTFKLVIDKIVREDPFVGNLQLYQWGEPLLNKNLPAMIEYARIKGIKCAVSSNLNAPVDYRSVIEAKPEWFRISVSGTNERYEVTHTGGKWDRFAANLETLCTLRNELHPEMRVELYFHIYRHTGPEDREQCRQICEKFGIEFHPVYAYLISLDDVLAYQEGTPLPAAAKQAADLMLFNLDDGIAKAHEESYKECDTFRSIHINWNLEVSNCMMYYYPANNIAVGNFLETPLKQIQENRRTASLCKRCLSKGMHRYCSVFSTMNPEVNQ